MRARRDASRSESASASASLKPGKSLQTIENTVLELLDQVRNARLKEDVQTKRIAQLEHENHALHLALQKLKEQRAKDKQVIDMWRQYTSQEAPTTDASTQEAAVNPSHIPSSPPIVPQLEPQLESPALPTSHELTQQKCQNSYGLSQRILPMSIDVDELYEGQINEPKENESNDRVLSSPKSELTASPGEPVGLSKRSVSQQQSIDHLNSQHALKRLKVTPRSASAECSPSASQHTGSEGVEDLLKRVWHPSDFVLNPKPRSVGSYSGNLALRETTHNRNRRQCVHGRECKNCNTFFDLMGPKAVAISGQSGFSQQETPAGFWRTDFPESEEAHEDQEEAQAQWTAEGYQRLIEAINEGKYLFKDKTLRDRIHLRLNQTAK